MKYINITYFTDNVDLEEHNGYNEDNFGNGYIL